MSRDVEGAEIVKEPQYESWTRFRKCQSHPVPQLDNALYEQLRRKYGRSPEKRRLVLLNAGAMEAWFVSGHVYYAQKDEGEIKLLLEFHDADILYPGQLWDKEGNIIRDIEEEFRKLGIKPAKLLPRLPTPGEREQLEYFFETYAFNMLMLLFGITQGWDVSRYLDTRGDLPPFTDWFV